MKYIWIICCFLFTVDAKVINFAPLPMDKAPKLFIQYSPLLAYLEKETKHKYKFNYVKDYAHMIEDFKNGKLDIIELGPLPFVRLKQQFPQAKAFLTFLTKQGEDSYTCKFITKDNNIKSLQDIDNKINLKLTRKLSTCGYLMSEIMLKDINKSLKNLRYEYVGTHSNVLLELLLKNETAGCAKSTVIGKFKHFDFKTLKVSPKIPGFAFIANMQTVSLEQIESIQNALLKLHPLDNERDKNVVLNWSENTKYGCVKTKKNAYLGIFNALKTVVIPQDKK